VLLVASGPVRERVVHERGELSPIARHHRSGQATEAGDQLDFLLCRCFRSPSGKRGAKGKERHANDHPSDEERASVQKRGPLG